MAWGLWNKIKQGIRKAGSFIKDRVLKPVVNTVVKPFKPVISAAANAINPKIGSIVDTGMNMAEKWVNGEKEAGNKAFNWAKDKFGQPKMTPLGLIKH